MSRKLMVAAVVFMIALGVGAAFAASQSSSLTSACVNDASGLLRAADACREGEHRVSIGGGGSVTVTQNGSFTVAPGETGGAKTLPLTGVTLSGRCETLAVPFGDGQAVNARILVEAPAGKTMEFFPPDFNATPTTSSKLLPPVASLVPGMGMSTQLQPDAILTASGATASLTIGGSVDVSSKACTFLWQAVEAAN